MQDDESEYIVVVRAGPAVEPVDAEVGAPAEVRAPAPVEAPAPVRAAPAPAEVGAPAEALPAETKAAPRVYVDGVFDLFHPGHVAFLLKARAVGGPGCRLVVGVVTDADARRRRAPVMTHAERVAMVRSCRAVSEVVEYPPLVLSPEFLDACRIDYVVHGGDDDARPLQFFRAALERGIVRYVAYTPGVSTSDLIRRAAERFRGEGAVMRMG